MRSARIVGAGFPLLLSLGLGLGFGLAAAGCHNTAEGVKADTRNALDSTGAGLQKAGNKIDVGDGGASGK